MTNYIGLSAKLQAIKKTQREDQENTERERILELLNDDKLWRYAYYDCFIQHNNATFGFVMFAI